MMSILATLAIPLDLVDGLGVTGFLDGVIADLMKLAIAAGKLFAIAFLVYTMGKNKLSLTSLVSAGFAAFLAWWLVSAGVPWGGGKVAEETTKGSPAIVQTVTVIPSVLPVNR